MDRREAWIVTLAIAFVSLAATVALIVWVTRLGTDNASLARRAGVLERELAATKDSSGNKHEVAAQAAQLSALASRVKRAEDRLGRVTFCLPELRREERSVQFQSYETGGYLTGGFLVHGQPISRYCAGIFSETNAP